MQPESDLSYAIYNNDAAYGFLIQYYLEDLALLETNDRWTLSQAMASWLPYEKHYSEILQKIEDLRAAASMGAREHEKSGC